VMGVFTPAGICAGFESLTEDGFSVGFAAWGDETGTDPIEGFRDGEILNFRLWDNQAGREFTATPNYIEGDGRYAAQGFALLTLQSARLLRGGQQVVEAGGYIEVPVVFRPIEVREYDGVLTVGSNDPYHPEVTMEVTGAGILTEPELVLSANEYNFGDVIASETVEWTFAISNIGQRVLQVEQIAVEGEYFSVDNEGGFSVEQGETTLVNVTFAPMERGEFEGTITITSNDPRGDFAIALSGRGLAPIMEVSPEAIDFGGVFVNSTAQRDLTITNIGDANLIIRDITSDDESFWAAVRPQRRLDNGWQYVETDAGMNIRILSALINEDALVESDYIGVFTPAGLCAGFIAVGEFPFDLTAWADDPATRDIIEGFREGEQMEFQFYDASEREEHTAQATFEEGENVFAAGGSAVVRLLVEIEYPQHDFSYNITDQSHSILIMEATLNGVLLVEGDEIGVFTLAGRCAGAVELVDEGNGVFPTGLAAWHAEGENQYFRAGDRIFYRVWDASARIEANAAPEYIEGPDVWGDGEFSLVNLTAEGGWRARPMPFDFDQPIIVVPNASTGVTVFFGPQREGEINATLTIRSNAPGQEEFEVTLTGVGLHRNTPPEWTEVPADLRVMEGDTVRFRVIAEDPENDTLRLAMRDIIGNLPEEARFTDNSDGTGQFYWQVGYQDTGRYEIEFTVTDGEFIDTALTTITVIERNQPVQVIGQIADFEVDEDTAPFVFADLDTVFRDPDGEPLEYSVEYSGEGLNIAINPNNREATLSLNRDFHGEVHITINAQDPPGSVASVEFDITVLPVNDPPVVRQAIADRQVAEDTDPWRIIDLDEVFTDIDGDRLTYRVVRANAPLQSAIENDNWLRLWVDIEHYNTVRDGPRTVIVQADDGQGNLAMVGMQVVQAAEPGAGGFIDRGPIRGLRNITSYTEVSTMFDGNLDVPRRDANVNDDFLVVITPVNDDPTLEPIQNVNVDEGALIRFDVTANDVDLQFEGDDLDLSVTDWDGTNQLGARFVDNNNNTGTFTWQTNNDHSGDYDLTFRVIDRAGRFVTRAMRISIADVNRPPVVRQVIADQQVAEDTDPWRIVDLDNVFSDPDGDQLTYRILRADEPLQSVIANDNWLVLSVDTEHYNTVRDGPRTVIVQADDRRGNLAMIGIRVVQDVEPGAGIIRSDRGPTRGFRSIDTYKEISAVFDDNLDVPRRDATVDDEFLVTITAVNDAPAIAPVQDVDVNEGALIRFVVNATDVDLQFEGDDLDLLVSDWGGTDQRGAQFTDNNDNTGTFNWQTNNDHSGDYDVTFRVNDRAGRFATTSMHIRINDINRGPEIIEAIADQQFDEDAAERFIVDLNQVFEDPDGDILNFNVPDPIGLNRRLDQGRLFLQPEPNWNGITNVEVIAADGRGGVVRDTFRVAVRSINDLPTAFNLLAPPDSFEWRDGHNLRFTWQRSRDIVEDSTVTYTVFVRVGGQNYYYPGLSDTTVLVRRTAIGDPQVITRVRWWVWANDLIDSVRSNQTFTVFVYPLSVGGDDRPLPQELDITAVYPNPFNDVVTIAFDLPKPMATVITIHDQLGRTVRTLTNTSLAAGRYKLQWDGYNDADNRVPSGLYICRMVTPEGVRMKRVVLMR